MEKDRSRITTTEAVKRAKDKLDSGATLDEWDISNLVESVAGTHENIGYKNAVDDVKNYLERIAG